VVKFRFLPREEKFLNLFEDSTRNMVAAAHELKEMVDSWEDIEERVAKITELEHKGDEITHLIMAQLHRTFVTPFDREDIALLAHSLDDVTDFIQGAADAMLVYKVEQPTSRTKELADIILQAVTEIERVIPQLKGHLELSQILKRCVEINRLENAADRVFRSAVAELFDNSKDAAYIIKWREIYEQLESATDRCEDVADVLEGVALKHA